MSAYMIFTRLGPVRDAEAMAEYQRRTREIRGDYKLKPLAIYGAMEAVEGEAPDGIIILEFPTVEDAKDWYNSDGYQAALPFRQKAADYSAIIVQGI